MNNYPNLDERINKHLNSFNIILADRDLETFKIVQNLSSEFNFINLSSSFAVNFILEYEQIDLIIISKKISDIENILRKANKKGVSIYILGKDIKLPIKEKEIENILYKEIKNKALKENNKKFSFKRLTNFLFKPKNYRKIVIGSNNDKKDRECKLRKENSSYSYKYKKGLCRENKNNKFPTEIINNKIINKKNSSSNFDLKSSNKGFEDDIKSIQENNPAIKNIKTIKQKVIILSKAKGGVGSTIISIFLGYVFNKVKTLLIDLNFSEGGGDISYYLGTPKSPNILNFIEGYNRNSLENSVIKIKKNLDLLQAPPTYEMSRKVDLQDIYCLTDIAKKKYHLVIFDLPNRFDDLLLGVIELADLLIMVSDYTIGSISRLVNINNRFLHNDLEKMLIVNKYYKMDGFNLLKNQIERFFHLRDLVFLEEDKILRQKSEFAHFNFNNLKSFNHLTDKVFNLLTYD